MKKKKKNILRITYIALAALTLAACGNGSGPAAAGTKDNPIIIPVDPAGSYQSTPYSGTVGTGALYFRLTGLYPDNLHTVVLSGMTDNADLYVYTDAFITPACSSTNTGSVDDICNANTSAQGELYIKVNGSLTVSGTSFALVAGT